MLLKGPQLCRLLPQLVSLFVDSGSCKYWLASGSNEFTVHVHDLGSMLGMCALSWHVTISLGCDRLFLLFIYCFFDELNRQKLLCVNAKPCFTPDSWFVHLVIALCSHDGMFSSTVGSLGQSHGFELESSSAWISSFFLLWWNCPGETSAIQLMSALKNQEHNKSNVIALWSVVMIYRRTDE